MSMSKETKNNIIGAAVTIVGGTLLHFAFDLAGQSPLIAWLVPVNESVWEHLKLIAIPMIVYEAALRVLNRTQRSWASMLLALICGMFLIVSLHYIYAVALSCDWAGGDIIIFIISVAAAYWLRGIFMKVESLRTPLSTHSAYVGTAVLILVFVFFTYSPPHVPLFWDAAEGGYGIITQ